MNIYCAGWWRTLSWPKGMYSWLNFLEFFFSFNKNSFPSFLPLFLLRYSFVRSFFHFFSGSYLQFCRPILLPSFCPSFCPSFSHSFIHSSIHSSIHSFIPSTNQSINQPTNQPINQSISQSINESIHSLAQSLTHSLTNTFIRVSTTHHLPFAAPSFTQRFCPDLHVKTSAIHTKFELPPRRGRALCGTASHYTTWNQHELTWYIVKGSDIYSGQLRFGSYCPQAGRYVTFFSATAALTR